MIKRSNEELNKSVEEAVWKTVERFRTAMLIGDYKKANALLDVIELGTKEKNN